MCKSLADGGQRCAAHTRRAFERYAMYQIEQWDDAAAQYASTAEGQEVLQSKADKFAAAGNHEHEARCRAALTKGLDIRDANADAAAEIAKRDLTKWEPVRIDDELARLYGEAYKAAADVESAWDQAASAAHEAAGRRSWDRKGIRRSQVQAELDALVAKHDTDPDRHTERAVKHLRDYNDLTDNYNAIVAAREPYEKEFTRRGGWNRAFLVTSSGGGHVHRSLHCSTCTPTTQYHWVTEFSDHSEAEIVEAAGSNACTVCYESAPVEVLNRPTRIFSPDQQAQQEAREQRATAAQEREAKKIAKALTPDGSEFKIEYTRNGYAGRERFKTEATATSWAVARIADHSPGGWLSDRPMDPTVQAATEKIITAISEKHNKPIEDVRADIAKKVKAKIKRDARG
jgi:hypothetical protein